MIHKGLCNLLSCRALSHPQTGQGFVVLGEAFVHLVVQCLYLAMQILYLAVLIQKSIFHRAGQILQDILQNL